jgi:hypothetical protein
VSELARVDLLSELRKELGEFVLSSECTEHFRSCNLSGDTCRDGGAVVRRDFSSVQTAAMSGAFSGETVPSGVTAHAFYEKSRGMESLLAAIESLPQPNQIVARHRGRSVSLSADGNVSGFT